MKVTKQYLRSLIRESLQQEMGGMDAAPQPSGPGGEKAIRLAKMIKSFLNAYADLPPSAQKSLRQSIIELENAADGLDF